MSETGGNTITVSSLVLVPYPPLPPPSREPSEGYVYAYLDNSDAPDRADPPRPQEATASVPRAREVSLEKPPQRTISSDSTKAKQKGAPSSFEVVALSDSDDEEEERVVPLRGRVWPSSSGEEGTSRQGGEKSVMTPSQAAGQAALRRLGLG